MSRTGASLSFLMLILRTICVVATTGLLASSAEESTELDIEGLKMCLEGAARGWSVARSEDEERVDSGGEERGAPERDLTGLVLPMSPAEEWKELWW